MRRSVRARSFCTSRVPGFSGAPPGKKSAAPAYFTSFALSPLQRRGTCCCRRRSPPRARRMAGAMTSASDFVPKRLSDLRHAGDRARHADREMPDAAAVGGLAVRVEVHVARRCQRRHLAVVDRRVAAVGEVHHHEAAAADVAGARIRHREREADRDRGVDRVAARPQDLARPPRWRRGCCWRSSPAGRTSARDPAVKCQLAGNAGRRRAARVPAGTSAPALVPAPRDAQPPSVASRGRVRISRTCERDVSCGDMRSRGRRVQRDARRASSHGRAVWLSVACPSRRGAPGG